MVESYTNILSRICVSAACITAVYFASRVYAANDGILLQFVVVRRIGRGHRGGRMAFAFSWATCRLARVASRFRPGLDHVSLDGP